MNQRPLFDPREVPEPKPNLGGLKADALTRRQVKARAVMSTRQQRVRDTLGDFPREPGDIAHVVSAGTWSCHDLIRVLLERTGPAELIMSTWSISEEGWRMLIDLRDEGQITKLTTLLDWRIGHRNPDVTSYAKTSARDRGDELAITNNHSKVYVLRNELWAISLISSANLTNNPRIEASVIHEDRAVADWHARWITETVRKSNPLDAHEGTNLEPHKPNASE